MFREGYASKILADVYAIINADKLDTGQKEQKVKDNENNNNNESDIKDNTDEETDV